MLLIESAFVLQNIQMPKWFLPQTTPHEIISTLHRLFPAFMSGTRCIISAFHVEPKDKRIDFLEPIVVSLESISTNMANVVQIQFDNLEMIENNNNSKTNMSTKLQSNKSQISQSVSNLGIMEKAVKSVENKVSDPAIHKMMSDKINLLKNPDKLKQTDKSNSIYELVFNFVIYFLVRLMLVKVLTTAKTDSSSTHA